MYLIPALTSLSTRKVSITQDGTANRQRELEIWSVVTNVLKQTQLPMVSAMGPLGIRD